jgi:hypothetical protein
MLVPQIMAYTAANFKSVLEALDQQLVYQAPTLDKIKHILMPNYVAEFGKIMLASQDKSALTYIRDQLWDFGVHTGRMPSIGALWKHKKAIDAIKRGVGHVIIAADFAAVINFVPKTDSTEFCRRILLNALQLYEANIM